MTPPKREASLSTHSRLFLSHDDVAHAATVDADMMMRTRSTSFAVANARTALSGDHGSRHGIMSTHCHRNSMNWLQRVRANWLCIESGLMPTLQTRHVLVTKD
jgi:hypothetical protein